MLAPPPLTPTFNNRFSRYTREVNSLASKWTKIRRNVKVHKNYNMKSKTLGLYVFYMELVGGR